MEYVTYKRISLTSIYSVHIKHNVKLNSYNWTFKKNATFIIRVDTNKAQHSLQLLFKPSELVAETFSKQQLASNVKIPEVSNFNEVKGDIGWKRTKAKRVLLNVSVASF